MLGVRDLEKRFGSRKVLKGLTFDVGAGEVVGVSGPNGSGKSTLLQILCGLQRPTRGAVEYRTQRVASPAEARPALGFSSPALQLYDDLTAVENLVFFARWRGLKVDAADLLRGIGLDPGRTEPLRAYSSGMRQRVKLAWALMHDPPALLLDEPGANLDAAGRELVARIVAGRREHGGWVILASNDPEELDLATRRISLV